MLLLGILTLAELLPVIETCGFCRYVDRTADVQSAAALTASAISADPVSMQPLFSDPRVEDWLETYRDLLDQWQLFVERAKFDVDRLQALGGKVR